MKWQYISKIENEDIFREIEKEYKITIPQELADFIRKYNAGTPNEYHIKINGVERIIGSVLSYNRDEEDVDSAFLAMDVLQGVNIIPFAVDPFGNYFCYKSGKVVFWKHEENNVELTDLSLADFIRNMY